LACAPQLSAFLERSDIFIIKPQRLALGPLPPYVNGMQLAIRNKPPNLLGGDAQLVGDLGCCQQLFAHLEALRDSGQRSRSQGRIVSRIRFNRSSHGRN
jgi:hypothetical protein